MLSKQELPTTSLPPLWPNLFAEFRNSVLRGGMYQGTDANATFVTLFDDYLHSSNLNTVQGLAQFEHRDIIHGCNHFIDNLLQQHGIDGLQIFEHDYRYYTRLGRQRPWAKPGYLVPGQPVLIAAPFPGALDLHWQWHDIIKECELKHIDIHVDAAWLGAARDIGLDLSSTAIASVAFSLSKGLGLAWNRIGVRYSRRRTNTDSITIFNQHDMISEAAVRIGIAAMQQIPVDYVWHTYEQPYHALCRELMLRPTKIIHAAMSIDRATLYSVADALVKKTGTEVPV